jgi:crotonobetainyl-CoA:carnitine CoA-transferase CaiB-like acyl-CoA transferase
MPLSGVRIVDFTANMSGPMATMVLGDQGAEVIKVEAPTGDTIRAIGTRVKDVSSYFANLNRSKRSLCVDLTSNDAVAVRKALFEWSDVVVHNLRPSAAARIGVDASSVTASYPHVVHAQIAGISDVGEVAELPVYDHVVQAISGIAAQQAAGDSGPQLIRQGVIDKASGLVLAQAITAGLYRRVRTGAGCALSISMLDVALGFLWPDAMAGHTALGPALDHKPSIASSFKLTRTLDGHISMAVATPGQWAALAGVVGIALPAEEDPDSVASWLCHGVTTLQAVRAWAGRNLTREVVAALWEAGVPAGAVVELEQLASEPVIQRNNVLEVTDHETLGLIRQPRPAVKFNGSRPHLASLRKAPRRGEHTAEILSEIGFTPEQTRRLIESGVARVVDR